MRLTPTEMNKIKISGIKSSGLLSVGKEKFIESLQYHIDEFSDKNIKIDIDKYGLRQAPEFSGKAVGNGFFGVYLTSNLENATRYALGIINDTPIRKNERSYVFVIEMRKSEIHSSFKEASPKSFAYKSGQIYHWLDINIPSKRIIHIFDLGERVEDNRERELILKQFLESQLLSKRV